MEVIVLPKFSVNPAHTLQQVLDLSLDILIFTEIGTHDIYFLAHSRLAKRTLSFWGHAITSGIVDFSHIIEKDNLQPSGQRGGPDYFISSVLFEKCREHCNDENTCQHRHHTRYETESNTCYVAAQKKYSERLLLQEGLTTYFQHPPLPLTWKEIDVRMPAPVVVDAVSKYRIPLIPDKLPFLAYFQSSGGRGYDENMLQLRSMLANYDISENDIRMYCIPQTLYKLSPGNIDIIKKLLVTDSSGVLVLLDGELSQPEQKQLIINEFPPSSLDRIVFLRKLNQPEYMTLLAISDIVLDTFPVGGGRSSFAIFSTGTPIVMLYSETSILQLTYGMYQAMGVACKLCIAYDDETYIAASIEIASNKTLQGMLRQDIMKYKHRLYENKTVIEEWEHMLRYVLTVPRPVPFEAAAATEIASDVKSALSITTAIESNAAMTDGVNWLQDLKRIHASSNSGFTFEEWIKELPLNVSIALSFPYSAAPLRLSTIIPNYSNMESTQMIDLPLKVKNNNQSDFRLSGYDKEVISLGVIIMDDNSNQPQTSQQKLAIFNKTVFSLKVALGLTHEEKFLSRNIKEVIVVDDGTVGMSVQDRVLFSSVFPIFHFIFERSKPNVTSKSKKKSWYKLKALSSLIKIAQYRYLFLIPSHSIAAPNPYLSPPLLGASQTFNAKADSVPQITTKFSFILRFALQLLNGYTNVTGKVDGFGLKATSDSESDTPPMPQSPQEHIFRQAAHVVLLNTLAIERDLKGLDMMMKYRFSDDDCERGSGNKIADGRHLLVGKCRKGNGEYAQPFVELHDSSVPSHASRYVDVSASPYCACSVADETYLDDKSTYFGGYIDEDMRDICGQNLKMKGRAFLSNMDSTVDESYRGFTCLLVLLNSDAREQMKLRHDEVKYLEKVQEFYLQPSLWDIDAVSFLIQGLEKEYLLETHSPPAPATSLSTRYRHKPTPAAGAEDEATHQTEGTRKTRRKKSLVKKSNRVDALYHARGEVVFDISESFEYQKEDSNAGGKNSICRYINTTAIIEEGKNDIFQCSNGDRKANKRFAASSGSSTPATRFLQRLLSSGVKVAYLSAELFSNS
jgi:hypothetical protein